MDPTLRKITILFCHQLVELVDKAQEPCLLSILKAEQFKQLEEQGLQKMIVLCNQQVELTIICNNNSRVAMGSVVGCFKNLSSKSNVCAKKTSNYDFIKT